jgi:hypothetical protein
MLLDHKDEWLATRLEDLDYGDIDGIAAAVRRYPLEGLVGSGVVEAGCKAVVGQRLKQSGMHWTVSGADAIIALALHPGQQPVGSHLQQPPQPDRRRLTSRSAKMIFIPA